jgi:uncharacterized cupredoxin-like copper-binding protein
MSSRALVIGPITALAVLGAACTSDDGGESSGDGISATLTDFAIDLGATSAPAGPVTFDITNGGATVHEFEVLRTDTGADALPVDSGVVQTSADGIEIVDEVEEIAPGTSAGLSVELQAGTYVVICNVSGHYEQGMFTSFTAG